MFGVIGAALVIWGAVFSHCGTDGTAIIGFGIVFFGLAVATGPPVGGWLPGAVLMGAGAVVLSYGLVATSQARCLSNI